MKRKLLIVQDDPVTSYKLKEHLNEAAYDCHILNDGQRIEPWQMANRPDMVLLDVIRPSVHSFELCSSIRRISKVPIIVISETSEEIDKVVYLDSGADDYICKPIKPREVVARVGAIFRRVEPAFGIDPAPNLQYKKYKQADFFLDKKAHKLHIREQAINLTTAQSKLLGLLIENEGIVLSRDDVIKRIYPKKEVINYRTIDSHIQGLRKHISTILPKDKVIFSVYGAGYKFERPDCLRQA